MTFCDPIGLLQCPGTTAVPNVVCHVEEGITVLSRPVPQRAIRLPQSRKKTLQQAVDRQRLLEAAMPLGTVLPIRSGMCLPEAALRAMIRANRPLIDQMFTKFEGRVQHQVTVRWDAAQVLARFRDAPELTGHFARGHVAPDALAQAVSRLMARLGADMQQMLAPVAEEMLRLPLEPDMLANLVLLVSEGSEAALDSAVEMVDAIWPEGLAIRQIGPAPAASFALIDPQPVGAQELAQARALLGASSQADRQDLARLRRDALLAHPDKASQIRRAADLLGAAERMGSDGPFHIFDLRSEDRALSDAPISEVA